MYGRSLCSLYGLSCVAALLGEVPLAVGQESAASVVATVTEEDGERDDLEQPSAPAVQRPLVCGSDLQNHIRVAGTVYDAQRPERSMALMGAATASAAGL